MAYRQRRSSQATYGGQSKTALVDSQDTRQSQAFLALSQQVAELVQELAAVKQRCAALEAHSKVQAPPAPTAEKRTGWAEKVQTAVEETLSRLQAAGSPTVPSTTSVPAQPSDTKRRPPPGAARSSSQAPWMIASPDSLGGIAPKWSLWNTEYLNTVDRLADRTLASLPEILVCQGHPDIAVQLHGWLRSEATVLGQIASALARRIVAIKRSERQSDEQRMQVASLALVNLTDSLLCRDPAEKQRCERVLSSDPERVLLIGTFLATAARTLDDLPDKRAL